MAGELKLDETRPDVAVIWPSFGNFCNAFLKPQDFISHQADFTEINEVLNRFDEPERIRTVLRF